MPIRIPDQLPAQEVLSAENIFVMAEKRASNQDIRPMQVGILNLMPNKIETEIQLLRLLSNTPLQVNVDLIRIDSQAPKNTPQAHMDNFYHSFDEIKGKKYDGLIVTGAPLGLMAYEDVKYWDRIGEILDWAKHNVQSSLFLCWAAHAAVYHYYGVDRLLREQKLSGVYGHRVQVEHDELMRGFEPVFNAPHSRYGEIPVSDYQQVEGLHVIASSDEAGAYIVASKDKRQVFVTGHPEYDTDTLDLEYRRDCLSDLQPEIPVNYYQQDNPELAPVVSWRAHGSLLLSNWLNYYVYQTTPYDLRELS